MAESVPIGSIAQGKLRNPLGVVGLSIITVGIYFFVWYYKVNKELMLLGRARNVQGLGDSPGTSLAAVALGWIVIVPPFVSSYNVWKRLDAAHRLTGQEGMEPGLGLLLFALVGPIGHYILQTNLNKVLRAQAGLHTGGSTTTLTA